MRKIYFDNGGDKLVVNGTLELGEDASIGENGVIPTQMDAIEDSTAATVADLVADFNALLAAMRTAGLIAAAESEGE